MLGSNEVDLISQRSQRLSGNTTAPTRLAAAVAPRLAKAGAGAIVNIGSVMGFAPEFNMSVYGASKAFVLFLSQGLHQELAAQGVYVQAVLPAATRTEIWERAGVDVNTLPEVMEVEELVDAALGATQARVDALKARYRLLVDAHLIWGLQDD